MIFDKSTRQVTRLSIRQRRHPPKRPAKKVALCGFQKEFLGVFFRGHVPQYPFELMSE